MHWFHPHFYLDFTTIVLGGQIDLNRNDGTLHLVMEATENSFSCFFCVRKETFLKRVFIESITNSAADLPFQHLSISLFL